MKRFNFRLNKLLELREFYEHQAEIELAQAVSYKDSIDIALKTLAKLKVQTGHKFTATGSALDINYLQSVQNYMIKLNEQKDELLNKLVSAEQTILEKRKIYIEAASKRKVISKLKEKKLINWKKINIKAEDDRIDDMVTFKSGKKLFENNLD